MTVPHASPATPDPTRSAALARDWVRAGRADLPLPARGDTRTRWSELTVMCATDVSAGRLAEAHADADAILAEIDGTRVGRDELWGVWAAEPPTPVLTARRADGGWVLDGVKAWCSGGDVCTHALVTALDDDEPRLFAVDLRQPGVAPRGGGWAHPGMSGSRTTSVEFTDAAARTIGDHRSYLDRPGFWHGGIGVAACWLGAGIAVARPLLARATRPDAEAHALAHLGGVDVALGGASWALDAAAAEVDRDGPGADLATARHRAVRVRALVEAAVDETIRRVGRALGAGPLAMDPRHAQNVLDAQVYIRQFHAERDLAGLGATAATHGGWAR
ncbi:acyl-CoA dehydrogenase family protein [Dietzia sp. ANT_WB102]|uniref:acyl-CoA dehydrogenase family protein n=1 Tax=Dietzia sp. ANT_WB102 TaxID=2597345 RepID=UPI0011EC35EB|nr:acyl-CoA dehydrogenase family protein [Dietzia sp. ANT_WB102]KAA0919233.1 acyl-CoA dehydrogenase [Dietzia sp. ANT_WB102]